MPNTLKAFHSGFLCAVFLLNCTLLAYTRHMAALRIMSVYTDCCNISIESEILSSFRSLLVTLRCFSRFLSLGIWSGHTLRGHRLQLESSCCFVLKDSYALWSVSIEVFVPFFDGANDCIAFLLSYLWERTGAGICDTSHDILYCLHESECFLRVLRSFQLRCSVD